MWWFIIRDNNDFASDEGLKTPADDVDSDGNETWQQDEPGEGSPVIRRTLLRLVAFITALVILGLAVATALPRDRVSLTELAQNSFQLKKNIDRKLTEAVVKIDVVNRRQGAILAERRLGTGFNIDPGGLIITNHHVIDGALNMSITFPDGKVYRAERWSSRPEVDIAVIALQAENLPSAPVDFSSLPAPGDKIRVVGNPLELNNILVDGKMERYLRIRDMQGLIFSIDAPIYPGNSGSPVYNMNGKAVGIIFGVLQGGDDGSNGDHGLAVAMSEAQDLIKAVIAEKAADNDP